MATTTVPTHAATDAAAPFATPARFALLVTLLAALAVAAALVGVSIGPVTIPVDTVWQVVGNHLGLTDASVRPVEDQIVWDVRVPRVLLGLLVGAGLALAGVVVQVVVRNPLGDPYLLGIAPGASLGAVAVIVLGSSAVAGMTLSSAAFVGAIASFSATMAVSRRDGSWHPVRLVLAGVAVGYALSSVTFFLQIVATPAQVQRVLFWSLGSVASGRWTQLPIPAVTVGLVAAVLLILARQMDALALGETTATTLGINVPRLQLLLVTLASLATGTLVAVAGGIGFVGLVIPHVARLLVGAAHRRVLLISVLLGAPFLVAVDLAARMARRPTELPLGIMTAAIGAPTFLFLLRRQRTSTGAGGGIS